MGGAKSKDKAAEHHPCGTIAIKVGDIFFTGAVYEMTVFQRVDVVAVNPPSLKGGGSKRPPPYVVRL